MRRILMALLLLMGTASAEVITITWPDGRVEYLTTLSPTDMKRLEEVTRRTVEAAERAAVAAERAAKAAELAAQKASRITRRRRSKNYVPAFTTATIKKGR